jgi:hypothetical protein
MFQRDKSAYSAEPIEVFILYLILVRGHSNYKCQLQVALNVLT